MEFTAIGDSVNEASRLEGLTKIYGTEVLLSQVLRKPARALYVFRSVDVVRVVGKTKALEVFSVIGRAGIDAPPGLAEYEQGVSAFRAGRFAEALVCFDRAADAGLNDKLTHIHRERCRDLIEHPPGPSWDGVFTATTK
jgi:adenylate cyclase